MGVLSIGKINNGSKQLEYYERQVADGIEDYYTGRGEAPGEWAGTGAEAIGLAVGEQIPENGFYWLMAGLHPTDLSVLSPTAPRRKVAAFDLTFSAPKSVSVLYAIGDAELSAKLVEAHNAAVAAAVAYLEREACWTRRGHAGVIRLQGEGFLGAAYRHRLSRARDPQLHTHAVVANMTRADGRPTTLDGHMLFEHKNAAGAVYRAVLRAEVREQVPWVSWKEVSRGLFEVKGVPTRVLEHFSQRRAAIKERARELVGSNGSLSREAMQTIALATRPPKDLDAESRADWRADARARAAEHGLGPAELDILTVRRVREPQMPQPSHIVRQLSGPEGLTGKRNTFARHHALAEIAGRFTDGITIEELDASTDGYLDHRSVERLMDGPGGEARYSTRALLECEDAIINSAEHRLGTGVAIVEADVVEQALAGAGLNVDQSAAVRALAASSSGVDTIQALAGTGKTTMLATLTDIYQRAGYTVAGTAPTAKAARELRETAGIDAGTIHSLVSAIETTNIQRRGSGLPPRVVLFIDEAGMAPTRISARLFAYAEQSNTKIIAVGDSGQLTSVEAGGWFAKLAHDQEGATLRTVMRQRDPAERDALAALRDGQPERYLAHKSDDITLHSSDANALEAAVSRWAQLRANHGADQAVMIVRDNATREQLNAIAREQLRAAGELAHDEAVIGSHAWAVGDRVIARQNNHRLDVDNGTTGTIVAAASDNQLVLRLDDGSERSLPPEYVARHLEHAYAITGHASQGTTVETAVVIGRPEEFTREWAYTALSRARGATSIELIATANSADAARADYAPKPSQSEPQDALMALAGAMRRTDAEPLASDRRRPQSTSRSAGPAIQRAPTPDAPSPSPPTGLAF